MYIYTYNYAYTYMYVYTYIYIYDGHRREGVGEEPPLRAAALGGQAADGLYYIC